MKRHSLLVATLLLAAAAAVFTQGASAYCSEDGYDYGMSQYESEDGAFDDSGYYGKGAFDEEEYDSAYDRHSYDRASYERALRAAARRPQAPIRSTAGVVLKPRHSPKSYYFLVRSYKIEINRGRTADNNHLLMTVDINDKPARNPIVMNYGDQGAGRRYEVNKKHEITLNSPSDVATFSFSLLNKGWDNKPDAVVDILKGAVQITAEKAKKKYLDSEVSDLAKGAGNALGSEEATKALMDGYATIWQAVGKAIVDLFGAINPNCDGIVAAQSIRLSGAALETLLNGKAAYRYKDQKFPGAPSPFGCGRYSEYYVDFEIGRVGATENQAWLKTTGAPVKLVARKK